MATIGITIPETVWSARSERFYTQVLHGLEDTAVSQGHTVLSHVAGSPGEEIETVRRWAERDMVDLLILKDLLDDDDRLQQAHTLDLPFVVIGDQRQGEFSAVTVDNASTMQRVLEDLHGRGHRAIGHVGGPSHLLHSRWRCEAYREFVHARGLPTLFAEGDYGADSGTAATQALLADPQRPTVIVYDNDAMAIAGAHWAAAAGLRVPEDLSIVAWDDSPACQTHEPPLAVLEHHPHQLGVDLARTAQTLLAAPGTPVRVAHEVPRLIPRGTLSTLDTLAP
ncbi:MAG: LacI family DNA-binding transcriptional regulator [Brachybacterium sp.]|uniref:LacI family DNA-binding transcriptional regulator n=1 Tax=Brachybacterium sp. TaxID=1891286 RepID=UPI003F8F4DC9